MNRPEASSLRRLSARRAADLRDYREAGASWDSPELRKVIEDLEHFGVKLGLDRMERLLEEMGEAASPVPTVVVGGTNGKGSVTAMLSGLLQSHGLRTGRFTSPHLSNISERFRIDAEALPDARLIELFGKQIMPLRDRAGLEQLTFFEAVTGLGRLAFRDCDAAVFEVGLGGRLDATKLCADRVAVVTNIDFDHVKTLGSTLPAIAGEKFAVLPQGGLLVYGGREPGLQEAAMRMAEERGGRAVLRGRDFDGEGRPGYLSFWSGGSLPKANFEGLRLTMLGQHQVENAVVALAGLMAFSAADGSRFRMGRTLPIDEAAVRRGLQAAAVEGRLEYLPGAPPVLMDGAHNLAGARSLAHTLLTLPTEGLQAMPRPRIGLLGFSRGKDLDGMGKALAGSFDQVVLSTAGHRRSLSAADARNLWPGSPEAVIDDPFDGLTEAWERADAQGGSLIVAGSLYLLGAVRPLLLEVAAEASRSPDLSSAGL